MDRLFAFDSLRVVRSTAFRYQSELGTTGHEPLAAIATLGAETGATFGLAGLLVKLANTDFLLDTAALHQLTEAAHCLLGCFSFAKS